MSTRSALAWIRTPMTVELTRLCGAYQSARRHMIESGDRGDVVAAAVEAAVVARTVFVAAWCRQGLWPHSPLLLTTLADQLFGPRDDGPGRDTPRTVAVADAGPFQALVSHGLAARVPSSRSPQWRRYVPTAKGARLLRACGYAVALDRERRDYDFGGPDEAAELLAALNPSAKDVKR